MSKLNMPTPLTMLKWCGHVFERKFCQELKKENNVSLVGNSSDNVGTNIPMALCVMTLSEVSGMIFNPCRFQ